MLVQQSWNQVRMPDVSTPRYYSEHTPTCAERVETYVIATGVSGKKIIPAYAAVARKIYQRHRYFVI
jgi:hypothetical protein